MKKFILPILILLLMVSFCVWATWRADELCNQSAQLLEQAGARCIQGDFHGAEDLVQEAKNCWDQHEGFFGVALRHTESDDVDILFPPLLETCRQQDAGGIYPAKPGTDRDLSPFVTGRNALLFQYLVEAHCFTSASLL